MATRFVFLTALLGAFLLQPVHVTTAQTQCQDLPGYFEELDARLRDDFLPLAEDEEWQQRLDAALKKADESDMSYLALSPKEMEPLIEMLSVQGNVLTGFPEDAVPQPAAEIHQTALDYWQIFPPMLTAIAEEGPLAGLSYIEKVQTANRSNLDAQAAIEAACPAEIGDLRDAAEITDQIEGDNDGPSVLDRILTDDFEGAAYRLLFYATEDTGQATATPDAP